MEFLQKAARNMIKLTPEIGMLVDGTLKGFSSPFSSRLLEASAPLMIRPKISLLKSLISISVFAPMIDKWQKLKLFKAFHRSLVKF